MTCDINLCCEIPATKNPDHCWYFFGSIPCPVGMLHMACKMHVKTMNQYQIQMDASYNYYLPDLSTLQLVI